MTARKAWKKFWRGIFHFAPLQWLIAALIALPIWFIYLTSRVKITNYHIFKKYRRGPVIFVFWHGRSLMLSPIICVGRMRGFVMTSNHADGRLMAKLQRLFGLRAVYGSSSAGAVSVLRAAARGLQTGMGGLCLSPDGPSGPSFRVQAGALYLAKLTGAPIVPVCYSASRAKFLDQWDKYIVPMPFSRITCRADEPIFVDKNISDDDFEKLRLKLEDIMYDQLTRMEAEFGRTPPERDWKSGKYKEKRRAERAARKNGGRK